MDILRPRNLNEAVELASSHPRARPLAGGTDVMVQLNMGGPRPEAILDLGRVEELNDWHTSSRDSVWLGARVPYTRIIGELHDALPGLSAAARTIGSPQIRNRGTVGGNAATASPAGDTLPMLYAMEAEVELAAASGTRSVPVTEFVSAPGRSGLRAGELITGFRIPSRLGPQRFAKLGPRNAMVIAVSSLAVVLDPEKRQVRVCAGSVAPTPLRARDAEAFIGGVLEESGLWESRGAIPSVSVSAFAEHVRRAAQPIDDVRGGAAYRRHAVGVLAERALTRAWSAYRKGRA